MSQYDPAVLEKFAGRLYAKAAAIVALYSFLGLVAGAVIGVFASPALRALNLGLHDGCLGTAIFSLLGLVLGLAIGLEKAFWLKVEAQRVLCLLQIEMNTRFRTDHNTPSAPQQKT